MPEQGQLKEPGQSPRAFSFSANVILSEAKNLKSLIRDLVRVPKKSDVGKNFRFFALLRMTEKYGMTR